MTLGGLGCYGSTMESTTNTVNRPVPNPGTDTEKQANFNTHWFIDGRCGDCDCRPWGQTAFYPCGAPAPRETITTTGTPTWGQLFGGQPA